MSLTFSSKSIVHTPFCQKEYNKKRVGDNPTLFY